MNTSTEGIFAWWKAQNRLNKTLALSIEFLKINPFDKMFHNPNLFHWKKVILLTQKYFLMF